MSNTRVKTGIPGFDELLNGGFLQGDVVMVAGSSGTGKTIFCLQYLIDGIIESGDPGLFISFEQSPEQIYRDALNFGWDLKKLEEENKFRLVYTSPQLLLGTDSGEQILDDLLEEFHPKRLAIDSLRFLEMFVENVNLREEFYRLIMYLKTKGISALLTWETPNITESATGFGNEHLAFLVDCIVLMRLVEIESVLKKVILVLKMRGSDHDKHLREYSITSKGITILPVFHGIEGIVASPPKRKA